MVFQFQLLGLFIMFLLIVLYFGRDKYSANRGFVYKPILIFGYIMQLFYIVTFILMKSNNDYLICAKLYFASIVILSFLYAVYFVNSVWEDNYSNDKILVNRQNSLVLLVVISSLIASIFIICSRVRLLDNIVRLYVDIPSVCMEISMMIQLLVLFKYYNKMDIKKAFCLLVVLIMEFVMLGAHFYFDYLTVINSGMILIILYLYMTLENNFSKEIDALKIERDNAIRNNIDKSAFLKNISHEIRTPINTIDGFSQVIIDSDNIDEIKEDARDIRLASRDLIDIINGMIDLSIIESGNLSVVVEDYDLYDMLDNVKEIVDSKLRDKSVKFNFDVDKDIPHILSGDATRISQVLLNILTNSIKFTDKGKIGLKVESIKSSNKCRLKFIISDTGKGISREDINNLFLYNENGENKGLGLIVSNYLVELMNGKIEVDSEVGHGSTFVVTIDQNIVSEKRTDKFKKKELLEEFDASDKKILVVDDNKLNIKVAVKLLKPYKVEVVEASSGDECLDILDKDHDFDLILMDDLMPNKSGTETLNILQKIERVDGYYIPVVVLTANAVSGMKEKYLDSGFDDYLAKPIDRDELNRILKKYLRKKG